MKIIFHLVSTAGSATKHKEKRINHKIDMKTERESALNAEHYTTAYFMEWRERIGKKLSNNATTYRIAYITVNAKRLERTRTSVRVRRGEHSQTRESKSAEHWIQTCIMPTILALGLKGLLLYSYRAWRETQLTWTFPLFQLWLRLNKCIRFYFV